MTGSRPVVDRYFQTPIASGIDRPSRAALSSLEALVTDSLAMASRDACSACASLVALPTTWARAAYAADIRETDFRDATERLPQGISDYTLIKVDLEVEEGVLLPASGNHEDQETEMDRFTSINRIASEPLFAAKTEVRIGGLPIRPRLRRYQGPSSKNA